MRLGILTWMVKIDLPSPFHFLKHYIDKYFPVHSRKARNQGTSYPTLQITLLQLRIRSRNLAICLTEKPLALCISFAHASPLLAIHLSYICLTTHCHHMLLIVIARCLALPCALAVIAHHARHTIKTHFNESYTKGQVTHPLVPFSCILWCWFIIWLIDWYIHCKCIITKSDSNDPRVRTMIQLVIESHSTVTRKIKEHSVVCLYFKLLLLVWLHSRCLQDW